MKIVTVIGARPQFIKAAAVSRKLEQFCEEIIVHTGQHYDANMSELFFEELHIPKPKYNLGVGSGSHARQTAEMLIGIEDILIKENPDYLMVYGDTNSTVAGALAASKIHIPVIHVEAGLRSFNMAMPEEQNRILTDHISSLLFCSTDASIENLENEGIKRGVHKIGDVMCDAVLYYSQEIDKKARSQYFADLNYIFGERGEIDNWYLSTVHRAENTDTPEKVRKILKTFEKFDAPVILPAHPRTRKMIEQVNKEENLQNTICVEPIGYLEMLYFTKNAVKVVTDSGGLQKEAYILDTPCVTLREQTEWVETLNGNHNVLAHIDEADILDKVNNTVISKEKENYYGAGDAADKLVRVIVKEA